jgi:integrase
MQHTSGGSSHSKEEVMPRRKSASLQARHQPACKFNWTTFELRDEQKRVITYKRAGCSCNPGPLYHVVSRPNGKQVREPIGRNREQARRELNRILGEIDDESYTPPQNLTMNEWLDEWEAGLQRPRASTRRVYGQTVRLARETFGTKLVRHIGTADVLELLKAADKNRAVSTTTKRRHLRVLHSILEAAVRRQPPLATANAVASLTEQQRPPKRDRIGSPFEAAELAKLWEKLDDPYRTLAKLSASTGIRQGELVALRWQDIDLEAKVIHVRASYAQGIGFGDPKSETSGREVILTPKVVELIKEWRKTHLPVPGALVFAGQGRDGQLVDSTIRRALYDAMEEAKIPRVWKPDAKYRPRDFHSFRHSYATATIGSGKVGLEWLKEQLGHSSVSVTERNYGHFLTDARQELAAGLDDALTL